LINSLGEVIGINTMIYSTATSSSGAGSIGIGWAIPINRVKKIINRFVTNKLNRANINRLGLGVVEPNSEEAQLYRLNFEQGLFVVEIKRNSLADKAGFQVGDVIIEINGEKVNSIEEFKSILLDTFEGDVLNFKLSRNDRIINLKIEF
jgi:serine protease Do